MALGSSQPLTEMSTRNLSGGKGRPARKTTTICEPTGLLLGYIYFFFFTFYFVRRIYSTEMYPPINLVYTLTHYSIKAHLHIILVSLSGRKSNVYFLE
jgi:hypothetical protein